MEHVIAPFFGLHPKDTKEELVKRLLPLKKRGFHKVTVEYSARPGTLEQARFDEIFFEAAEELCVALKELGMSFWLQDAAPFPSGNANGALERTENRKKGKCFVEERHVDVTGPRKNAIVRVHNLLHMVYGGNLKDPSELAKLETRDLLAVTACRLNAGHKLVDSSFVRLDSFVKNGFLEWDVPKGHWRIFVLYTTFENHGRKNFINLLSEESVALQIEQVHMPVYEHLKDHLGKEWNGFFYDEPEIGNTEEGCYDNFNILPGRRQKVANDMISMPWSLEMSYEMEERDSDWILHLPYLYYDGEGAEHSFRYLYMDAVTELVKENYNGQVHRWMREQQIPYIGHVLEDENSHSRLGCGCGNFFRVEYHQDMAGVDLISAQIMPGADRGNSWYGAGNGDGEFYHYMLAKLASSEAHINPHKNNQSFCEAMGVYGPMNSPKYKKFLIDHLLVNGISRFIFGDSDNYGLPDAYVEQISSYTDWMSYLMGSSEPVRKTAVLYHAQMEWAGWTEFSQRAAGELARHQISYDLIPADVFTYPDCYDADFTDGLKVNGNSYQVLVIPGCEYLPLAVEQFINDRKKNPVPVFVTERVPEKCCETGKRIRFTDIRVVKTEQLAEQIKPFTEEALQIENLAPWVRVEELQHSGRTIWLLHNEAPADGILLKLSVGAGGKALVAWNPLTMECEEICETGGDTERTHVSLYLEQFELKILSEMQDYMEMLELYQKEGENAIDTCLDEKMIYKGGWNSSRKDAGVEDTENRMILENTGWNIQVDGIQKPLSCNFLTDLGEEAFLGRDFSGCILYKKRFYWSEQEKNRKERYILDLGSVYETAEVLINGKNIGFRFTPPYRFDITGVLKTGENILEITVYNNTVNRKGGGFLGLSYENFNASPVFIMEPSGLLGPVTICRK